MSTVHMAADATTVRRVTAALAGLRHLEVRTVRPSTMDDGPADLVVVGPGVSPAVAAGRRRAGRSDGPPVLLIRPVSTPTRTLVEELRTGDVTGLLDQAAVAVEIVAAVSVVSRGHFYLSAGFQARWKSRLLGAMADGAAPVEDLLTDRERDVLDQLFEGRSNRRIADALHISPATVDTHLLSIFRKFGVRNRTEAVAKALRGRPYAGGTDTAVS